jgi:prevent-host-death family protein
MTAELKIEDLGSERPEGGGEKAPFGAGGRMAGRILGKIRLAPSAPAPALKPAAALPSPGATLRRLAATAVARRFGETIDEALLDPVIIERHGRPCAVLMSVERFQLHERLAQERSLDLAAEDLRGAIAAACDGRLKTSASLRLEARRLRLFADRRRR